LARRACKKKKVGKVGETPLLLLPHLPAFKCSKSITASYSESHLYLLFYILSNLVPDGSSPPPPSFKEREKERQELIRLAKGGIGRLQTSYRISMRAS